MLINCLGLKRLSPPPEVFILSLTYKKWVNFCKYQFRPGLAKVMIVFLKFLFKCPMVMFSYSRKLHWKVRQRLFLFQNRRKFELNAILALDRSDGRRYWVENDHFWMRTYGLTRSHEFSYVYYICCKESIHLALETYYQIENYLLGNIFWLVDHTSVPVVRKSALLKVFSIHVKSPLVYELYHRNSNQQKWDS